jgi:phosphoribosyl-ATP pyrophosphohydrolase
MMVDQNITIEDVEAELDKRAQKAGNLKQFHVVDKNS